MAHCANCGSPLPQGAAFCTHCGARAGAPAPQPRPACPPPSPGHPPAPPPAKGGGIGKILLIVGGVVVLLGVLAVGGLVVTGVWIKKKVETAAERMGVPPAPPTSGKARRYSDPCSLLSASEASRVTGIVITRTEARDGECLYYGSAEQASAMGQAQAQEAIRKMRENQAADEKQAARLMEDLMKGLAASGLPAQDGVLFHVKVTYGEEAKQQESAFRLAMGLLSRVPGAEESASKATRLDGIGDRAYLAPLATSLVLLKGDAWVEIGGPGLPGRDALAAVARAVAARL